MVEFTANRDLKQAIASSDGSNTSASAAFDAPSAVPWPAGIVGRAMNNRFLEEWRGREDELRAKAAAMPQFALLQELAKDPETAINWAGQSSGLVDAVLPAATGIERTIEQAERLLRASASALPR